MNVNIRKIIFTLLIIIIQLLLDNYLNLGVYIYIAVFPYLILTLPYKYHTIYSMLLAFILGLTIDLFGNGVLGLNAGALTVMAAFRQVFLQIVVNEQSMGKYASPSIRDMGFARYSIFSLLSYLVFFIAYVLLDNMGFTPILFNILKIFISSSIGTLLFVLLSIAVQERK